MVAKKDKYEQARDALVTLAAKVIALDRNGSGELEVDEVNELAFKKVESDIQHISDVILEHQVRSLDARRNE